MISFIGRLIFIIFVSYLFYGSCAPRKIQKIERVEEEEVIEGIEHKEKVGEPIIIFEDDYNSGNTERNGYFQVQIFATKNHERALIVKSEISKLPLANPIEIVFENGFYKVRVGKVKNKVEAEVLKEYMVKFGFPDAFIIEVPPK